MMATKKKTKTKKKNERQDREAQIKAELNKIKRHLEVEVDKTAKYMRKLEEELREIQIQNTPQIQEGKWYWDECECQYFYVDKIARARIKQKGKRPSFIVHQYRLTSFSDDLSTDLYLCKGLKGPIRCEEIFFLYDVDIETWDMVLNEYTTEVNDLNLLVKEGVVMRKLTNLVRKVKQGYIAQDSTGNFRELTGAVVSIEDSMI